MQHQFCRCRSQLPAGDLERVFLLASDGPPAILAHLHEHRMPGAITAHAMFHLRSPQRRVTLTYLRSEVAEALGFSNLTESSSGPYARYLAALSLPEFLATYLHAFDHWRRTGRTIARAELPFRPHAARGARNEAAEVVDGPAPAEPAVKISRSQLHGRVIADGRFVLGERVRAGSCDEVRRGHVAGEPDTRVLITLTARHAQPLEVYAAAHDLAFEGIAPLVWYGVPGGGIP